jgi:hypothetical protein
MNKRKWKFNFRGEDDTVIIAMTPDQAVFPSRLTKGSTSATYRQIRRPEPCLTKITPMTVILLNAHKIYLHIFVTFLVFYIKIRPKCTVALIWFHSFFSRKKSEIWIAFTFFEKWKVKSFSFSLFSRNEKW